MKTSIEGFNQKYAVSLQSKKTIVIKGKEVERVVKLDGNDLIILRWFVDFYPKMKKMIVNGEEYAWLSYKKLTEDLPIIDISKRAFADRLQKLVEFNILKFQLIKENGTFTVYGFGENYINLVKDSTSAGDVVQNATGCSSNDNGVGVQSTPKDKTIKEDKNIKDSKERKKETYDTIISQYALDESVISALYDFIKMRKMIKKPMTDRALKMLINKLLNMTSDPETQVTILENSILKNWTDIYELKGETKHDSNKRSNKRDGSEYSEYD